MRFSRPASPCRVPAFAVATGCLIALMTPAPADAQVAYEARIEGVVDPVLLPLLQEVSNTISREGEPPETPLHLRRRARRDLERFTEVFQSNGYYAADVSLALDRNASPVVLIFEVDPGPQYKLGDLEIVVAGDPAPPDEALPPMDELGLVPGAAALAQPIADANAKLLTHLKNHGYPAPRIVKRDVVVVHGTQTVNVTFRVDTGPRATFGAIRFDGLDTVRPVVVEPLVPWEPGDSFDQRQVSEMRSRLYDTGLFGTASVAPVIDEIGEDGTVPIQVELTERPHRTMTAGLEYKSDEGIGAQYGWEHRNFGGLGHTLSFETTLATELREINVEYHIDRFRRLDQSLVTTFTIAQEEREAYDSDRVQGLEYIERKVTPRLSVATGVGFRIGRVTQLGETNAHQLIHFPLEARLDHADDPLNPTRGFKLRGRLEPFVDPIGEPKLFVKAAVEFSYYLGIGTFGTVEDRMLPNWVLATRVHLGAIAGEPRDRVPADVRYYAGGGGSIRGYRFQTVSPLIDDDPIGGRSLAEFSFEVRRRLTETLGVVAFVDGGGAFESPWPDFDGDIQFGAGVGVRYFTALGPLRFDLAVPLNKRDFDDSFQVYLSIGHAF